LSVDFTAAHLEHHLLERLDRSAPQENVPALFLLAVIDVEALSPPVLDMLILRVVRVKTVIEAPVEVLLFFADALIENPDHARRDPLAMSFLEVQVPVKILLELAPSHCLVVDLDHLKRFPLPYLFLERYAYL
jgi:hypothetical protein